VRQGYVVQLGVLPGPYTIRVRDSIVIATVRVDSADQIVPDSSVQQTVRRIATMPVEAGPGRVSPVDVQLPWRASVSGCGPVQAVERRFLVMGVVLTADSLPIPNARVRLRWDATSRESTLRTLVDAIADAGGGFFMCGIPAGIPLATHLTTPAGAEFDGTTTVSREDYDEQGRRRVGTLRALRLIVSPPDENRVPRGMTACRVSRDELLVTAAEPPCAAPSTESASQEPCYEGSESLPSPVPHPPSAIRFQCQ
jgi:hypothetical protein